MNHQKPKATRWLKFKDFFNTQRVALLLGCCLSTGSLGDTILQFAFMSMGLRGAVVLVPMCCALWLPGKIPHKFAMCSIIVAPLLVLIFGVLNVLPFDALFIGIAASLLSGGAEPSALGGKINELGSLAAPVWGPPEFLACYNQMEYNKKKESVTGETKPDEVTP